MQCQSPQKTSQRSTEHTFHILFKKKKDWTKTSAASDSSQILILWTSAKLTKEGAVLSLVF